VVWFKHEITPNNYYSLSICMNLPSFRLPVYGKHYERRQYMCTAYELIIRLLKPEI